MRQLTDCFGHRVRFTDERLREVGEALARAPLVALLGPRKCGKTTLAHEVAGANTRYFDLERGPDRQSLAVAAEQTLGPLRGTVVLDEVQTMPMRVALNDLKLETLFVVYAGDRNFPLVSKIEAVSLANLGERIVDLSIGRLNPTRWPEAQIECETSNLSHFC